VDLNEELVEGKERVRTTSSSSNQPNASGANSREKFPELAENVPIIKSPEELKDKEDSETE